MKKPKQEIPAMAEIVNLDDYDDDDDEQSFLFTPLSTKGNTKRTAISVEHYSLERDLNFAIMASLNNSTKDPKNPVINDLSQEENHNVFYNVDDYDDNPDSDLRVLNFKPRISGKKRFRDSVVMIEKGQSSKSKEEEPPESEFLCEICFDPKPKDESFSINGCSHSYCKDCMANYVRAKLQENVSRISCPDPNCSGLLEPYDCRSILPPEVFDRWGNALCEALILGSQKFYCPYKDCSVMLIDDGGEIVRDCECPNCRRMFCAQCKVPWHAGIQCAEFQKLHKDEREKEDIMLMNLAKNKKWKRCPSCRIFVEKTQGCNVMRCRCGASFNYGNNFNYGGHLNYANNAHNLINRHNLNYANNAHNLINRHNLNYGHNLNSANNAHNLIHRHNLNSANNAHNLINRHNLNYGHNFHHRRRFF